MTLPHKNWQTLIITVMIAIVSVVVLTFSYISYRQFKSNLIKDEMLHLDTVSRNKVIQINRWISERIADANALTSNLNLIERIAYLASYPEHQATKDFINSRFTAYVTYKDYESIFLVDFAGNVLAEWPHQLEYSHPAVVDNIQKAKSAKEAPTAMFRVYCSCPGVSATMNERFSVVK